MIPAPNDKIEKYRIKHGPMASDPSWGNNGQFAIPHAGIFLFCQVSDELGWEHVSVSLLRRVKGSYTPISRTPSWEEMCAVKNVFWSPEETAVQYHPPEADYINCHPYCLHLWRSTKHEIPIPPKALVGV